MTNINETNRKPDAQFGDTTHDSVNTDKLWNGSDILLIGTSGQLIERRDPEDSTTPVTDAINDIEAASGGKVILPPGTIDDDGPVPFGDFVTVEGTGHGGNNASEINITGGGKGLEVPSGEQHRYGGFEGVKITNGAGLGNATGPGVHINGILRQKDIDIRIDGWERPFVSDAASYENNFKRLFIVGCDAGNQNGLIDIQSIGPTNDFGTIAASPVNSLSGTDSKVFYVDNAAPNVEVSVGAMNIGGTASWAIDRRGLSYLEVGKINWEPAGANSVPDRVVYHSNDFDGHYRFLRVNGEADNAFFLNGGEAHFGNVRVTGTLNGDTVFVNTDISEAAIYDGASGDVNNASGGTLTAPVSCLADQTLVE